MKQSKSNADKNWDSDFDYNPYLTLEKKFPDWDGINKTDYDMMQIMWEQCLPKVNNIKGKVIITSIPIGDNYFHELYLNNMQQRTKLDDILDRMPLLRKKYEEWDPTVHTVVKTLEHGGDPLNLIQQLVINNIELSDRYKQFVDDVNHLTIYRQRYE